MSTLNGPGTRAILIGTQTGTGDNGLPTVPAVRATLDDLNAALVTRCGVEADNVKVVLDPASPTELGLVLADEAEKATDVLLVYYVGHGMVSPGGDLYLATASSDRRPTRLAHTSLAFSAVRDSVLDSRASSVVVILDCCYSGRAIGVLNDSDTAIADLTQVYGGCVLTSAARDELALAPEGATHTAFSGEVIRFLTEGDPQGPPELTLRDAYQYLSRTLPAQGYPRPHQRVSEVIEDLVLVPNPAYRNAVADIVITGGAATLGTNSAERSSAILDSVNRRQHRLQYQPSPSAVTKYREFLSSQSRIYVIKGSSGSGKSRLVTHLASVFDSEADFQLHTLDSWDVTKVDLATEILRYASIPPAGDPLLTLERAAVGLFRPCVVVIDGMSTQTQLDRLGRQVDSILRQVTVNNLRIVLAIRTPPDVSFASFPVLAASIFELSVRSIGTSFCVANWDERTANEVWTASRESDEPSFMALPESIQQLARRPLFMELLKTAGTSDGLQETNAYRLLDHCVRSILRSAGGDIDQSLELLCDLAQGELLHLIPTQLLDTPRAQPTSAKAAAALEPYSVAFAPLIELSPSRGVAFAHDLIREYALATRVARLMVKKGRNSTTIAALNELAIQSTTSAMARGLFEFVVYAIDSHSPELASSFALAPQVAVTTTLPIMLRLARTGTQFANNEVLVNSARRCTNDEAIDVARSLLAIPNISAALGDRYTSWILDGLERFGARIWPDTVAHIESALYGDTLEQFLGAADVEKPSHATFLARYFHLFADGSHHQNPLLERLLGHSDWRVRAGLAHSLAEANTWTDSLGIHIANRLVTDEDYKVRGAIARAAGRISGTHLWQHFDTTLTDPSWYVRGSLLEGLLDGRTQLAVEHALAVIAADNAWSSGPQRIRNLVARLTLLFGDLETVVDTDTRDRALRRLLRERRSRWIELPDDLHREFTKLAAQSDNWLTRQEALGTNRAGSAEVNPREIYRRMRGGRMIQVALDLYDLDRAVVVAKAADRAGVDYIEIGDPLIKAAGVSAIERLRREVDGPKIVAEMMSADWGRDQVELAVEAGADVVFLIGPASAASVAAAAETGRQLDVPILLDVPTVQLTQSWIQDMERAGVDGFCVTTNIDQGVGGQLPLGKARAVRSWTRLPVAVSGGFSTMDRPIIGSGDWDILIVGRSIAEAVDPEEAARQMMTMVKGPRY